jgi:poly(A) polymerase
MSASPSKSAREVALELARTLKKAGHDAFFAGGCVRDTVLGHTPKDYDIATSARPNEILELFPGANEVGAHFGVIIVARDGHHIEIATFRTDGSYRDGRRPESVEFSSAEQDAKRRDFTINGLFEDPESGEIIDHVEGRRDLEAGVIRAIGSPAQRFQEDALRLLRAVRFAAHLGFEIEPETRAALHDNAHLLDKISPERIRDEFSRIITSQRRRQGIEQLVESGLLEHFLPEFLPTIGCDQPPQWHPEGDVYIHTLIMLEMLGEGAPLELWLGLLFEVIVLKECS